MRRTRLSTMLRILNPKLAKSQIQGGPELKNTLYIGLRSTGSDLREVRASTPALVATSQGS